MVADIATRVEELERDQSNTSTRLSQHVRSTDREMRAVRRTVEINCAGVVSSLERISESESAEITSLRETVRELRETVRELRETVRELRAILADHNESIHCLLPTKGYNWTCQVSNLHLRTERLEAKVSNMKTVVDGFREVLARPREVYTNRSISTIFSHHPIG